MERWKSVPFAPSYEVSDQGHIRRVALPIRKARVYPAIRGSLTYQSYRAVVLRVNNIRLMPIPLHRIIMETFVGASELPINHKNGKKADNRLVNLEYVTAAENRKHAKEILDAYPKGSGHPNAKLSEADIPKIRAMIAAGVPDSLIGPIFNCTAANIYVIRKNRGWTHVK